jgi:ATP-binding cassette subfamily C protein
VVVIADPIPIPTGPITFEAVSYQHADDRDDARGGGVHTLSLQIPSACLIGVAGPSGSGKTTFADLLAGLYTPQSGRIAIGGRTLAAELLPSWRDRTSYVPQDAFLFHDSIRRNLAWANPNVTEDDMWQALAFADAENLVKRMPQGLDTMMGERGNFVSGGERQRIALARAVLRKPELLILDEATSGVDLGAERAILVRLLDLTPLPTIVLISHRPESLQLCDRIIRFANGRVVKTTGVWNAHATTNTDGPVAL